MSVHGPFDGKVVLIGGAATGIDRATTLAFLCSVATSYITGQIFVTDGRQTVPGCFRSYLDPRRPVAALPAFPGTRCPSY